MLDAIALGELLIDFATIDTDRDGYPTLAAHPGARRGIFWPPCTPTAAAVPCSAR